MASLRAFRQTSIEKCIFQRFGGSLAWPPTIETFVPNSNKMINESSKNEKSSGNEGKITTQESIDTPGHKDKSDGLDFREAILSQNDYLNSQ